jgi:hypothetical protein
MCTASLFALFIIAYGASSSSHTRVYLKVKFAIWNCVHVQKAVGSEITVVLTRHFHLFLVI